MASSGFDISSDSQPPAYRGDGIAHSLSISSSSSKKDEKLALEQPQLSDKDAGTVEILGGEAAESLAGSEVINHPASKDDVLTHTIHLEDDPSLPAVTFRSCLCGVILAAFGGVMSAIYYFKPQTILISPVFLAVFAYLLGEGMSLLIPRRGWLGRFLNPHPFTSKEHTAIVVMANSASIAAYGIELLAVNKLYYNINLNGGLSIFLLFSSQFLGFGLAGLMRKALVYPKNMLWPAIIPVNSMLENLHRPRSETRKQLIIFGIVFSAIFVWEFVPEYLMPILTGVSIFCLANQKSAVFTNIFGGTDGNEGLGLFSICFDWQYISGGVSPLYFPLESLISQGIGVCLCAILFCSIYYSDTWDSASLPFLSQQLFSDTSNSTNFVTWNQTAVLGADNRIDPTLLAQEGLPLLAGSYVINILTSNMMMSAAVVHIFLWNWRDIKPIVMGFSWTSLKAKLNPKRWGPRAASENPPMQDYYDPHYQFSLNYKYVPDWWYAVVLVLSMVVALVCIYEADSTLPWWGFFIACIVAAFFLLFFGAVQAISGVGFVIQPLIQLIGGYILPGNPIANMYFTLYGYNSVTQGILMAEDLRLAQYAHLAPRVTFSYQMFGAAIGAIFNYIMMNNIVKNEAEVLLSVEGTNIWSGQQLQQFNTLSVAWGGLAHELFSVGGRYEWCTLAILLGFAAPVPFWLLHKRFPHFGFDAINTTVMLYFSSYMVVGINSSIFSYFIIGFASQLWVRRKYPTIFVKYNYLVSAALDGGASIAVFIMTFVFFGAAGLFVAFPEYWGNNVSGNMDLCLYTD